MYIYIIRRSQTVYIYIHVPTSATMSSTTSLFSAAETRTGKHVPSQGLPSVSGCFLLLAFDLAEACLGQRSTVQRGWVQSFKNFPAVAGEDVGPEKDLGLVYLAS